MRRRSLTADAVIAVVACVLLLGILATGGLGEATATGRGLDPLGAVLVMVATLPLAARRLAPLTVFVVVAAATMVLWLLDYRTDIPLGALIGIYTLGSAYGGARPSRGIPALLAVAALVPGAAAIYAAQGFDLGDILVPEILLWTLVVAGVWIAGDLARLRRERLAELEDRARRTEREAERERRVAAAEERIRIARELHDAAGHAINVILVQAGAARLLHARDPAGSVRAITTIEEVARDTIGEIDRLVQALRQDEGGEPVPADPAAIEELVERYRAGGLRIATNVRGTPQPLPRSVAWAAYRILQEALTNAARHGRGSADVTVQFGVDAVDVTVTNPAGRTRGGPAGAPPDQVPPDQAPPDQVPPDQVPPDRALLDRALPDRAPAGGAPPGPAPNGGHGIVGMRERATLLGGTLDADQHGEVFRLHAWLPHAEAVAR